ncbi:M polyprotein [Orthobunyavirus simbuense]|uniref:Envelopment polyprotein n=1 Tax=Simbu virus TaxID=3052441 RepID=J4FCT9_SIMBU|nr:M polyprotein [Orthobunyavirus simbuense]CCG93496.1 M polyprotein [Orthobunyavirus simbuense]
MPSYVGFTILLCATIVASLPLREGTTGSRCFSNGDLVKTINTSTVVSEVCLKDDISLIKSIGEHYKVGNQLAAVLKYFRLYQVKDWHTCNPILDEHGTFMIMNVQEDGLLMPKMHTCRVECDISVNKETGEIVLHSYRLNHYRIAGTIQQAGWFKNKIEIPLENTCENIEITCGLKTMNVHACFRQHKSCTRYFKGSLMPELMIESICTNIELILLTTFILVSSIIMMILTKTYIVYILIPLFYPFVKVYGIIYNKYFKLCKKCLLAVHPFSDCPTTCICGMVYNNTESLKLHRLCSNCTGYRALTKSRRLCKSKGWNIFLCICFGLIFFSFITPVQSECFKFEDLTQEFKSCLSENAQIKERESNNIKTIIAVLVILLTLMAFKIPIVNVYQMITITKCKFCGMLHYKKNLKVGEGYTNKCLFCICSEDKGLVAHTARESCKYYSTKNIDKVFTILLIVILVILIKPIYGTSTDCREFRVDEPTIEQISKCLAIYQNKTSSDRKEQVIESLKQYATKEEIESLNIPDDYEELNTKIEQFTVLEGKIFLEYYKSQTLSEDVNGIKILNDPQNIKWKMYIKHRTMNLCMPHSYKYICRCIHSFKYCSSTATDHESEITTYYRDKAAEYTHDLNLLLDAIKYAVPGLGASILDQIKKDKDYDNIPHITGKLQVYAKNNIHLLGILKFIDHMRSLSVTGLQKGSARLKTIKSISSEPVLRANTVGESPITSCYQAKKATCVSPKGVGTPNQYLLCQSKLYLWPMDGVYVSNRNPSEHCADDTHCHIPINPPKDDISKKVCREHNIETNTDIYSKSVTECSVEKFGTCNVKSVTWQIAVCNGVYYYTSARQHAKGHDITSYCLTASCTEARYPFRKRLCTQTVWDTTYRDKVHIKKLSHTNIENYIAAIQSELSNDLSTHSYRPLKNLPKVIPTYKSISIQGDESKTGVRNAFVKSSLPAITGVSTGLNVKFKDGSELFSLVVFVKKIIVKATYRHIYTTGPTVGINTKHNEICTGTCPKTIPGEKNWLTFSKEHTSNWGCEEWGCLAIGAGCLYGSCQDILKPELRVYKKVGTETREVEVCITMPHETFCNLVDVLQPLISERVQISLETVDVKQLPTLIGIKNGKVLVGDINDLGNTAKKCGSVQITSDSVIGSGTPKFDYICHAAQRKDVIVRRCYDNAYDSCRFLQEDPNYNIAQGTATELHLKTANIGQIDFKVMLGDFDYDVVSRDSTVIINSIKCAGCSDCVEEMACALNIQAESSTTCKVTSNCELYMDRIILDPAVNDYSLKLSCKKDIKIIKVAVCKSASETIPILKQSSVKLDLTSLDESAYIQEHDKKCGTWLCRVKEEGLSIIFEPIFGKISYYWKIFIAVTSAIIGLLALVYICFPVCKRLKGLLEQNERIYQMETKFK